MYNICKKQSRLPKEALSMIRYHSFYPWHREGAYRHLMNTADEAQLQAVRAFNRELHLPVQLDEALTSLLLAYDLYSKSDAPPNVDELKEYYQELIGRYFNDMIEW
jgi:inositol oxygenase